MIRLRSLSRVLRTPVTVIDHSGKVDLFSFMKISQKYRLHNFREFLVASDVLFPSRLGKVSQFDSKIFFHLMTNI